MEIERIELIGGHPALDFVNSMEGRGSEAPLDYLPDFRALARWCAHVGVISRAQCETLLQQADANPRAAGQAWREAMSLRATLDRIFRALAEGEEPPAAAMRSLDRSLRRALGERELTADASGALRWSWREGTEPLRVPAREILLAAATLMTDGTKVRRIKVCAGGPCDWIFLDASRTGRRRWCRMSVCGNNAKVRRYRDRKRSRRHATR